MDKREQRGSYGKPDFSGSYFWNPVSEPVQPVSPTRLRAKTAFPSGSSSSVPRGSPGMESCIRRRKHASCRPTGSSFP